MTRSTAAVAKPVAKAYVRVVPQPIRTGVTNFFANLNTPTVMINDALQGKFLAAANDLGRFLLNTTVGLGGLLDPATSAGLDKQRRGFRPDARPLGRAPGSVRGTAHPRPLGSARCAGQSGRYLHESAPVHQEHLRQVRPVTCPYLVDRRASLLPLDETLKHVYDPYAFIRDAYLAHRAYLITGKVPDEEPLVDPGADMPDAAPASSAPASPRHRSPAPATPPEKSPTPSRPPRLRNSGKRPHSAVSNSSTSLKRAS